MMDKHKSQDPRTGHPPFPGDIEKARTRKTRIELEENEDLEVDEGTEASDPDAIEEEMRNQDA